MFLNFIQYILKEHIPNFTHKKAHTQKWYSFARKKSSPPLASAFVLIHLFFDFFFRRDENHTF